MSDSAASSEAKDPYGAGPHGHDVRPARRTPSFERAVVRRHEKQADYLLTHEYNGYKIPVGVAQALRLPLVSVQIWKKYPWAVHWRSRRTGGWRRKLCSSLYEAISFHRRAVRYDSAATIISRSRAYDIPPELRGRLPAAWKWCPFCMKPRRYRRVIPLQTFTAEVKVLVTGKDGKPKPVWKVRTLALMKCPVCRNSNRHAIFRRSNQPWELRKFKRGAIRARGRQRGASAKRARR